MDEDIDGLAEGPSEQFIFSLVAFVCVFDG